MTEKNFFSAIILSAGRSERMGFNKMRLKIGTKSVIERTLEAFEECGVIDEIILAASPDDIADLNDMVQRRSFTKVTAVVKGGQTRQESALIALGAVSEEADFVAVHDGARPLVKAETILSVARAAVEYGGAVAGVRCVDTLKEIDNNMMILSTIDRSKCVQVRTPQIFKKEILVRAHEKALKDGFVGTDECMLVERCGYPIKVTETSRENVKITYPEDITYVTEVLRARGKL